MTKQNHKAKKKNSREQVANKKINSSSMRLQDNENLKMSLKGGAYCATI